MRTYKVKAGDSPASIASQDDLAGCPKCSADLIRANPQKESVTYPNGFVSFKELRVGEDLNIPDKWFEPGFDLLPPAYFGSLPYADGITPRPFGADAPIILRHFRALDVAADKIRALAAADDQAFARTIGEVAEALDAAVEPALGRSPYAQAAREAVRMAIPAGKMLTAFAATGMSTAQSRESILQAFRSALSNAQYAMKDLYATTVPK